MSIKTIEVRKQDGSPFMTPAKSDGTKAWPLKYQDHYGELLFSYMTGSDELCKALSAYPVYHRGKLKGDIQVNKDMTILIISEEYHAKLFSKENRGAIVIGDKYKAFVKYHFPEIPCLYLKVLDDTPNLMGLYDMIEESYCDTRYATRSFSAMEAVHEQYLHFKAFRESKEWEVDFTPCGYQDEQLSFSVKIGGEWHFVTRFQAWEVNTYWNKLFTKKTKRIVCSRIQTTIDRQIAKDEKFLKLWNELKKSKEQAA